MFCSDLGHLKSALKNAPFRVEIFRLKIVKKFGKIRKSSKNPKIWKNPKIVKKSKNLEKSENRQKIRKKSKISKNLEKSENLEKTENLEKPPARSKKFRAFKICAIADVIKKIVCDK